MNKEQKDFLNEMVTKYCIVKDIDTFTHQHYTIITRSGIEKIQAKEDINITYSLEHIGVAGVIIKAIATKGDKALETFGSASKDTSYSKYYAEMAEKRAMSRAVLKIIDAYRYGIFGEDESDEFKNKSNEGK
jgi:hypothetical protein